MDHYYAILGIQNNGDFLFNNHVEEIVRNSIEHDENVSFVNYFFM